MYWGLRYSDLAHFLASTLSVITGFRACHILRNTVGLKSSCMLHIPPSCRATFQPGRWQSDGQRKEKKNDGIPSSNTFIQHYFNFCVCGCSEVKVYFVIYNCPTVLYLQCDYSNQGHPNKFFTNLPVAVAVPVCWKNKNDHKCIDYVIVRSLLRSRNCRKFIVNTLDFHLSICTEFCWVALVKVVAL